MRFTRALRGGGNWDLIPPEKIPSPNFWNKVVKGTPYEFTQVQLSRKGLHHAWTRHEIAKYDTVMRRNPYMVCIFFLDFKTFRLIRRILNCNFFLAYSFQRRTPQARCNHHRWHYLRRRNLRILPIRPRSPPGPRSICISRV